MGAEPYTFDLIEGYSEDMGACAEWAECVDRCGPAKAARSWRSWLFSSRKAADSRREVSSSASSERTLEDKRVISFIARVYSDIARAN